MKVKVYNESTNELPAYATSGSAGVDLRASFSGGNLKDEFLFFSEYDTTGGWLNIFPGGRALVPTDLFVAMPDGLEIQIRPRSGLALKHGVSVLNTPGTIDSKIIGVVKQGELLESLGTDNQQPSLDGNIFEGSETNNRSQTGNAVGSNVDTSALLQQILKIVEDDIVRTVDIDKTTELKDKEPLG